MGSLADDAKDVLGHIESVQLHQSWYKIRPGFPNLIITDLCDMNKYSDTCNMSMNVMFLSPLKVHISANSPTQTNCNIVPEVHKVPGMNEDRRNTGGEREPYQTIPNHTKPYQTIPNHTKPYQTIPYFVPSEKNLSSIFPNSYVPCLMSDV